MLTYLYEKNLPIIIHSIEEIWEMWNFIGENFLLVNNSQDALLRWRYRNAAGFVLIL
jgi:hypothetical protein